MITAEDRKKIIAYDEKVQEARSELKEIELAGVSEEAYNEYRQEQKDKGEFGSKSFYTHHEQEQEAKELQDDYSKMFN